MTGFHANGKLLLSSEYVVLSGAKALAVPLLKGQRLQTMPPVNNKTLLWKAYYLGETWLEAEFDRNDLKMTRSSAPERSGLLSDLLKVLAEMKPAFREELKTNDIRTELEFDPLWGFGSSSTLIALMARWAGVDPFELHFRVSKGSGYDIACALSKGPLLYRLKNGIPESSEIRFNPPFSDRLWFVWLGNKQRSETEVARYRKVEAGSALLDHFSDLTCRMTETTELEEFGGLMIHHEALLSELLGKATIRETHFGDLHGWSKSLGAWGGDFALLASPWPESKMRAYLNGKGINQIFNFNELVRHA